MSKRAQDTWQKIQAYIEQQLRPLNDDEYIEVNQEIANYGESNWQAKDEEQRGR